MAFLSQLTNRNKENILINTNMRYCQRHGLLGFRNNITSSSYTMDRFLYDVGGGVSQVNFSQIESAPGYLASGSHGKHAFRLDVSTGFGGGYGTNDIMAVHQYVEGTIAARRGAIGKPMLMTGWVRADKAYTLPISLRSSSDGTNFDRSIVYTHNVDTVWSRYAFAVPASDLSIHTEKGRAYSYTLGLGLGPVFEAPSSGVWHTGNFMSIPGVAPFGLNAGEFIEYTQPVLVPFDSLPSNDVVNSFQHVPHGYDFEAEERGVDRYFQAAGPRDRNSGDLTQNVYQQVFMGTGSIRMLLPARNIIRNAAPDVIPFNPIGFNQNFLYTNFQVPANGSMQNESTLFLFNTGGSPPNGIAVDFRYHWIIEDEL